MQIVIHCELVAYTEGLYSNYVFKNLDKLDNDWNQYFSVTKLPNWETPVPTKGEEIFLTIEIVKAGETYIKADGSTGIYSKDGQYFINYSPLINSHTNIYNF